MKIGVLTGGGDAPGLNAVIRAIVLASREKNYSVIGIKDGWAGLINGSIEFLNSDKVEEILPEGGTILGTSRTNPLKDKEDLEKCIKTFKQIGLDALVAIGGEDTLGVAKVLFERKIPVIGIPKTIDNDVNGTDYTFGFWTAVERTVKALDDVAWTAKSHHRVIIVEIMGRHTGWLTLYGGVNGGAHVVLIPEFPIPMETICETIIQRYRYGKRWVMIALAEGYCDPIFTEKVKKAEEILKDLPLQKREIIEEYLPKVKIDAFGHPQLGGIANVLAEEIEKRTKKEIESFMPLKFKFEVRTVSLGHLLRGGSPSPFDRFLGTMFGLKAVELINSENFGKVTALKGTEIVPIDFETAVGTLKTVPESLYQRMKIFLNRD